MTSPSRSMPFRAGRLDGEQRPAARAAEHPSILIPGVTRVVDISEFQPDINDATYVRDFSEAAIIRAAYGASHDDRAWFGGDRRKQLHQAGIQYLGMYQYITAFEDITAQAREFCRLVGQMEDGEDLYADIEEGSGNLQGKWQTWANVVHGELGWAPSDYSGANFAATHGLAPVDWVASYGTAEPAGPHKLWQFTDSFSVPGVGSSDCSVFHGSVAELRATAFGGGGSKPQPQPAPQPQGRTPAFPYPPGDYLGIQSQDPHCHSGYIAADQPPVRAWQQQMARRGWTVTADGRYGTQSYTVCTQFQAEKGLAQDGKVGPATWRETWTAAVT